ncbi:hypothetical protein CLAIMM_06487, partial [Cladophialophora immunda]
GKDHSLSLQSNSISTANTYPVLGLQTLVVPTMCRLCGRVVKCIFDSMPSRVKVHHVPSRRAFTTTRRVPKRPASSFSRATYAPDSTSLVTRAFSGLSLRTPSASLLRPSTSPLLVQSSFSSPIQSQLSRILCRSFSTTPTLLGYRRRSDTYSPSRRVQKRRHGYLTRLKSKGGQEVLKRRRLKRRNDVTW